MPLEIVALSDFRPAKQPLDAIDNHAVVVPAFPIKSPVMFGKPDATA